MGKGLLAWWRGRVVARGVAAAALLALPVAAAALIGFGGTIGGLTAVTHGPESVNVSNPGRDHLNRVVIALASPSGRAGTAGGTGRGGSGGGGGNGVPRATSPSGVQGVDSPEQNDNTGTANPSTPVQIPGTGAGPGSIGDTVNGVLNGAGNAVNSILGGNK